MSESTALLQIKLLASGDLTALSKGREESEALKTSLEGLKVALEMVGAGLSLGELVEGTKAAIEYGESLDRISIQAGITTDALQKLAYAGADVGLKQDELSNVMNVLNRNMAQAAEGATKQNFAIEHLGLNTAELLSLPLEKQIEAIAKAYVGSADKTAKWADVIALLGKNAATAKPLLEDLGKGGLSGVQAGLMVSEAGIKRLHEADVVLEKMGLNWKALRSDAFLWADKIVGVLNGKGIPNLVAEHMLSQRPKSAPESGKPTVAENIAMLEANKQMVTAHKALAKALADENKAYEGAAAAATRLRAEASAASEEAETLSAKKGDPLAQENALKLLTNASHLRAQANVEDAKAMAEQAKHAADIADFAAKSAQLGTKQGTIQAQITQAKAREAELGEKFNDLWTTSLTYAADYKKITDQLLAVKTEISTLEEKDATARVEELVKNQEMQNKREAIAIAAIEHDANLTDTQKWEEKRKILTKAVGEQERYIANMQRIAGNSATPQGARDKAGQAAGVGANALAGTNEQLTAQGANPNSFAQNFSAGLTKLQSQWGTLQQSMASGLTGAISSGLSAVSSNITKLITGAQSLGQAFRNIAVDIGTTLVQAFVDMGVKWVAQRIMMAVVGKATAVAETAAMIPIAAAQLAIWTPAATMATIASFGGAALAAPLEILAAIGESQAMSVAGFESGGFTGGTDGQPAGIVHGNEFVWSAPAVRNIGAGNLERAHQAAISGGSGVSAGGGGGGNSPTIINAFSGEDIAKAVRGHTDVRIYRATSRMGVRVAL